MHLLLIEDNTIIASAISEYLSLEGWKVEHEHNGTDGLQRALSNHFDCIMLDVMLPGIDGRELLHRIRKKHNIPVIMTTAKGTLEDKAHGFEAGADDYLVKPFELKELAMRLQALVKRSNYRDIIHWYDLAIDSEANRITSGGKEINLTLKEWQILNLLISAQGATVQRATIIDELRGEEKLRDSKSDGTLDVYIANLRKKLGKELIETVKGLGYKISSELVY